LRIIGVDPGKETGLALWVDLAGGSSRFDTFSAPADQAVYWVWQEIEEHGSDLTVAVEKFEFDQDLGRKTPQYDALHVTGAVKFKCLRYGCRFVEYLRSDAKTFGTDRKLKLLGVYKPGPKHANDAARQVLMNLAGTGHMPKLKF
jgi:hypothetical protein